MKICSNCIIDETAIEIAFDEKGVCNFCHEWQAYEKIRRLEKTNLPWLIHDIKKSGQGKKYDCLIGLSGGVDSSLALHYLIEQGLRPLAYQCDNGWNTKESEENIHRLVETLKVPFYRYVLNIPKFRELQRAFIQSGVTNVEATTDHMLFATSYEMATKNGIKYIISGGNHATEGILPKSWGYQSRDLTHLKGVYKVITGKKLKGLPMLSLPRYIWYRFAKGIKVINLLDYYSYNRTEAIKLLQENYLYQPYGEKHCESFFTKWFQSNYLTVKFGIDKQKAHYSTMINSGQMSREEALDKLRKQVGLGSLGDYQKSADFIEFITANNLHHRIFFDTPFYTKIPIKSYKDYPNSEFWWNLLGKIYRKWKS